MNDHFMLQVVLGLIGEYIGKIYPKVKKDLFSLLKRGIILHAIEGTGRRKFC